MTCLFFDKRKIYHSRILIDGKNNHTLRQDEVYGQILREYVVLYGFFDTFHNVP